MKLLSLNCHSWIEDQQEAKIEQIIDHIAEIDYDLVALQEVNQLREGPLLDQVGETFFPCSDQYPIRADNFAYLLVKGLEERGLTYFWAWAFNHIGYDRYEEGVALLAKRPFSPQRCLLSAKDAPEDYRTRAMILADFPEINLQAASLHLSWWSDQADEGFQYEWSRIRSACQDFDRPSLLMGDFNAPSHIEGESYSLARASGLQDAYHLAPVCQGDYSMGPGIAGWSETDQSQRIDLILMTDDFEVASYQSQFDGVRGPIVSDHYGVSAVINPH